MLVQKPFVDVLPAVICVRQVAFHVSILGKNIAAGRNDRYRDIVK